MSNDQSGTTIEAPPMRIVMRGWLGPRELSHAEAEAYHLREGNHDEARRNRVWAKIMEAARGKQV